MNSKTARKIRRLAMSMVVAAEEQGKKIDKIGYLKDPAGSIIVAQDTWKGANKALKKGLKSDNKGAAYNEALQTKKSRREALMSAATEATIAANMKKLQWNGPQEPTLNLSAESAA